MCCRTEPRGPRCPMTILSFHRDYGVRSNALVRLCSSGRSESFVLLTPLLAKLPLYLLQKWVYLFHLFVPMCLSPRPVILLFGWFLQFFVPWKVQIRRGLEDHAHPFNYQPRVSEVFIHQLLERREIVILVRVLVDGDENVVDEGYALTNG